MVIGFLAGSFLGWHFFIPDFYKALFTEGDGTVGKESITYVSFPVKYNLTSFLSVGNGNSFTP